MENTENILTVRADGENYMATYTTESVFDTLSAMLASILFAAGHIRRIGGDPHIVIDYLREVSGQEDDAVELSAELREDNDGDD